MKEIVATTAFGESGANRGMMRMVCPACGVEVRERELEDYSQEEGGGKVEVCIGCRENFEQDEGVQLESDLLPDSIFDRLYDYFKVDADTQAEKQRELNETTAPLVAEALGGEASQSGSGIWLVIKRTSDGRVMTISSQTVAEFENEQAFKENRARQRLALA